MSNDLSKKLQIKAGQKILMLNQPEDYKELLAPLPDNVELVESGINVDQIHLFTKSSLELSEILTANTRNLAPTTVLWVMYPKKSSGIKSDLEMMGFWEELEKYGLRPVSSISVNETWTALRFKPVDQVKKSGVGNTEIANSEMADYIDVKNKVVTLPPDLQAGIADDPVLLSFFESLAWSHKKEYVTWILSAKQEKTRVSRVQKAIEMLGAKKKNPTDK